MELRSKSFFVFSKIIIGKTLQCAKTLSLSKLDGIVEYLPEELYIKVKAGTNISKIENELKKTDTWHIIYMSFMPFKCK